MGGFIFIIILGSIAWVCFCIYFFVKALGFVMNATNLYRSMITRQESIISLLLDIRDNTKNANINPPLTQPQFSTVGTNNKAPISQPITGNVEYNDIIKGYQQIKQQYGNDLSDAGIILKLEEELKTDQTIIKRAIDTFKKTQF